MVWLVSRKGISSKDGTMTDFTIAEMLTMQEKLQERYKDKWEPITADTGKNKLLWMIGEIGEVIDIVKKNGVKRQPKTAKSEKNLLKRWQMS